MGPIDEPSSFIGSDESAVGDATGRRTVQIESVRPMRSDAVKNRTRILQAAEEIFSVEGIAVPIDAVAAKAGVGVGTLYRHFPNKEALFEAIVIDRISQLLETADVLKVADDPGAALFAFLRELAQHASAKRDLFDALTSAGIDIKSRCSALVDEMMRNLAQLLNRAVTAGAVRDDLSAQEIINLVIGTCHAGAESGIDEAGLQRMVGVVIDGLRPVSMSRPSS
jgi:AcrR family transcriptional regulator